MPSESGCNGPKPGTALAAALASAAASGEANGDKAAADTAPSPARKRLREQSTTVSRQRFTAKVSPSPIGSRLMVTRSSA